jgi:ferredoxin--NADP+ reductase
MTYVITQSCAADASCVVVCPVNCIHPAPGEPGFAEAEMLYIDAAGCVGCGACVTSCPAGAIVTDSALAPAEEPFRQLSADYYATFPHADRLPVALVDPERTLARPGPFRVAVVGAGPAGLYAADELLRYAEVDGVDVFDRLRTPYGLLRHGVAPDHQRTKNVARLFAAIEGEPGFRYLLGVDVGTDITLAELRRHYDAVIVAVGASADRRLGITGEDLPGSVSGTDLVGWYNGHPDHADLTVPLDHERAVIIGNGNVALDVARILTANPDALARTDLAPAPLDALRASAVREAVILGRRGPADASFTVPELIGLCGLEDVDIVLDPNDLPAETDTADETVKLQLLRRLADRPIDPASTRPRIVFRFNTVPNEILGDGHVTGVRVTSSAGADVLDAGLVVRAIGHRALAVPDLPFDEATATVPNDRGRVAPGTYVVGWIKRGPSGFIGTNKTCAHETVGQILDDFDHAATPAPASREALDVLLAERCPDAVDLDGWRRIDLAEQALGRAAERPRAKIVDPREQLAAARA